MALFALVLVIGCATAWGSIVIARMPGGSSGGSNLTGAYVDNLTYAIDQAGQNTSLGGTVDVSVLYSSLANVSAISKASVQNVSQAVTDAGQNATFLSNGSAANLSILNLTSGAAGSGTKALLEVIDGGGVQGATLYSNGDARFGHVGIGRDTWPSGAQSNPSAFGPLSISETFNHTSSGRIGVSIGAYWNGSATTGTPGTAGIQALSVTAGIYGNKSTGGSVSGASYTVSTYINGNASLGTLTGFIALLQLNGQGNVSTEQGFKAQVQCGGPSAYQSNGSCGTQYGGNILRSIDSAPQWINDSIGLSVGNTTGAGNVSREYGITIQPATKGLQGWALWFDQSSKWDKSGGITFGNTTFFYPDTTTSLVLNGSLQATRGFTTTEYVNVTKSLQIPTSPAASAAAGSVALVAGGANVVTSCAGVNSLIFITAQSTGGTLGTKYVSGKAAGRFDINSSALDTSTVAWWILNANC